MKFNKIKFYIKASQVTIESNIYNSQSKIILFNYINLYIKFRTRSYLGYLNPIEYRRIYLRKEDALQNSTKELECQYGFKKFLLSKHTKG